MEGGVRVWTCMNGWVWKASKGSVGLQGARHCWPKHNWPNVVRLFLWLASSWAIEKKSMSSQQQAWSALLRFKKEVSSRVKQSQLMAKGRLLGLCRFREEHSILEGDIRWGLIRFPDHQKMLLQTTGVETLCEADHVNELCRLSHRMMPERGMNHDWLVDADEVRPHACCNSFRRRLNYPTWSLKIHF